ncbi:Puromycin-sensitive aminopeptidase [Taenia crassiceps]|uniref:Puromycin-sensitive aminopeptidase n=1 Tax=Taenia crassiceps TaxID=6207 RepID=A0ABR4Q3V3_9CEST
MAGDHRKPERLPRAIKPINYKLDFVPNFTNFTFTAYASVELEVVEPTNRIIFNSSGLKILSASYQGTLATVTYDEAQELVAFEFTTGLTSGSGYLNLEFNGKFANDMLGLYRSTYTDSRGKESNILATQFESVFARRAFPCLDEPDRKATFEISIVALDNQVALSNMPEISRDIVPTPLDLVAIPDFACNAMENWGLVTYRETALLIDPENSSMSSKQNVALVVAHELAHMWFGNLVTMSWWTDLWLNEGFAKWAQYLAVDHCFPDYDIWTLFVSREYIRALRSDELKSSHPIQVEVHSAQEVEEIFDAVSYQKGSCVIRMLHSYMGDSLFHAGLKAYFEKFKYSNAKTEDLWTVLEATGIDDVADLMTLWTKQTGYPVVSVRLIHAPDGTYSIGVRQQRFFADGSSTNGGKSVRWRVPITVCLVDDSNELLLRKVTKTPTSSSPSIRAPNHSGEDQSTAENEAESQEVIYPLPDFVDSPEFA